MTPEEHHALETATGQTIPAELDAVTARALAGMIGATRAPSDDRAAVIVLRGVTAAQRPAVVRMILARRAYWLDWQTRTQRDWQASVSRRPSRQRHHDSGTIRERYVRGSR